MTDEQRRERIAALLVERDGYEARGLTDRVAEVDYALRYLRHEARAPGRRAQRRTGGKV